KAGQADPKLVAPLAPSPRTSSRDPLDMLPKEERFLDLKAIGQRMKESDARVKEKYRKQRAQDLSPNAQRDFDEQLEWLGGQVGATMTQRDAEALRYLGAILEVGGGVLLIINPTVPGVSQAAGVILILHGLDTGQAAVRSVAGKEHIESFTFQQI